MVFTYENGKGVDCTFPCAMLQGYTTMTACEHFCPRYYRCDNIAMADDEIKEWEERVKSLNVDNMTRDNYCLYKNVWVALDLRI